MNKTKHIFCGSYLENKRSFKIFNFFKQKMYHFEVPMFGVHLNYGSSLNAVFMAETFVRTLGLYGILKHTSFSEIIETDAPRV